MPALLQQASSLPGTVWAVLRGQPHQAFLTYSNPILSLPSFPLSHSQTLIHKSFLSFFFSYTIYPPGIKSVNDLHLLSLPRCINHQNRQTNTDERLFRSCALYNAQAVCFVCICSSAPGFHCGKFLKIKLSINDAEYIPSSRSRRENYATV